MTEVRIPALSLVLLVGVSGSGKSTFATRHFGRYEVVSSDFCRGIVANDENDQAATKDAFDVLNYLVGTRLRRGLLTVVDATNVQPDSRKRLIQLAREHDVLIDAIVLDVPESVAVQRNQARSDRPFDARVVRRQNADLRRHLSRMAKEGFRAVHVLRSEDIDDATVVRERGWTDKRDQHGPFDIIGDVHGCRAELVSLLAKLGWEVTADSAVHPDGRTALFVGDLVDRGPDTPGVLRLVMGMVAAGNALCVSGNHEDKLVRALKGAKVRIAHGLEQSLEQLARQSEDFQRDAKEFMDRLISHYVLDDGRLVVAHAGLKEALHGRASRRVRAFALFGETSGETDEYGLPVRYPWARDYRGSAMVVYGHTPTVDPEWVNNTLCVDTGAVFGGQLTALRYPEREIVSVPAQQVWYEPVRPLAPPARDPDELAITDVQGTRHVETRHNQRRVKIDEQHSAAALEVMSRFAVAPEWVMYLPPTMSPPDVSRLDGYLEHPAEAFAEYAAAGIKRVVCEEKHMGSRAVVVLRDGTGVVYTRTGRAFFPDTSDLIDRLWEESAALRSELGTSWLALDCELMPWSAKAESLIKDSFASVGAAAGASLPAAVSVLAAADDRGLEVDELLGRMRSRLTNAKQFREAYERYCWPTNGLDGLKVAPFQILACEGRAPGVTEPHEWHLDTLRRLHNDGLFVETRHLFVDLDSVEAGVAWWEELTAGGSEGMVVKPAGMSPADLARQRIQPGIKVRGREYLRIIYGPDYLDHLDELRKRSLSRKRGLALREQDLGLEALARVADGEPLWRVHEAVFGVLALESEPVDPRL